MHDLPPLQTPSASQVRAFPALLASLGFWRVAQVPVGRWLGSVRQLLRLGSAAEERGATTPTADAAAA